MNEERLERLVREAAPDYHRPRETPREAIWAGIERERRREAQRRQTRSAPWRWSPAVRWGVGIAAALVVGIGIGRLAVEREPRPSAHGGAAAPEPTAGEPGALAYQVVAQDHLSRAETFLTLFQADARRDRFEVSDPAAARALLMSTRLILDSPAGRDPQLRALLEDLELVLVQVANLAPERAREEAELIEHGMEQRSVLLRLRAAAGETPVTSVAQGEL